MSLYEFYRPLNLFANAQLKTNSNSIFTFTNKNSGIYTLNFNLLFFYNFEKEIKQIFQSEMRDICFTADSYLILNRGNILKEISLAYSTVFFINNYFIIDSKIFIFENEGLVFLKEISVKNIQRIERYDNMNIFIGNDESVVIYNLETGEVENIIYEKSNLIYFYRSSYVFLCENNIIFLYDFKRHKKLCTIDIFKNNLHNFPISNFKVHEKKIYLQIGSDLFIYDLSNSVIFKTYKNIVSFDISNGILYLTGMDSGEYFLRSYRDFKKEHSRRFIKSVNDIYFINEREYFLIGDSMIYRCDIYNDNKNSIVSRGDNFTISAENLFVSGNILYYLDSKLSELYYIEGTVNCSISACKNIIILVYCDHLVLLDKYKVIYKKFTIDDLRVHNENIKNIVKAEIDYLSNRLVILTDCALSIFNSEYKFLHKIDNYAKNIILMHNFLFYSTDTSSSVVELETYTHLKQYENISTYHILSNTIVYLTRNGNIYRCNILNQEEILILENYTGAYAMSKNEELLITIPSMSYYYNTKYFNQSEIIESYEKKELSFNRENESEKTRGSILLIEKFKK